MAAVPDLILDGYERQLLPLLTEMNEQDKGESSYIALCCLNAACLVKDLSTPFFYAFGCFSCCFGCAAGTTGIKNIFKACDRPPQDRIDAIFKKAHRQYFSTLPKASNNLSKIKQELQTRRNLFFNISSTQLFVYGLPLARDIQKCKEAIKKDTGNLDISINFECDTKLETERQQCKEAIKKGIGNSEISINFECDTKLETERQHREMLA